MQLIIGGYAQGKLNYVLQRYTDDPALFMMQNFRRKKKTETEKKLL